MGDRLETALFDLGSRIEYPETPRQPITAPERVRSKRGWVVAAAAAVMAIVVFSFPGPRQAVADLFGIGAVRVDVLEAVPEAAALREPSGEVTTLDKASREVDFAILTLDSEPGTVHLDKTVPGGMVTLGYGDGRLYVTQLPVDTEESSVSKLVLPDTEIVAVTVAGEAGFWIEGDGHALAILDRNGRIIEDSARLAADTLLYTTDGLTVRIEGRMTLDQAMTIASQLN